MSEQAPKSDLERVSLRIGWSVGTLLGMVRTGVLSDQMWARVEPLLPSSDGRPGRPFAITGRWSRG